MLIRFITSNFLSFNQEEEFNMLASSYRSHKHHVYKAGKVNVLKGAAIYGANGAGKSNFVKAIEYFKNLVTDGAITKSINSKKFKLNKGNAKLPVEFEIEFYYKKKIYAYGLSINKNTIEKEWLYLSSIDKEDKLIFERKKGKNEQSSIKVASKYLKTQKSKLLISLMEENVLQSNELLLGKAAILKITDIKNAKDWISDYLVLLYPSTKAVFSAYITEINESQKFKTLTDQILRTFNTGITKLYIENINFEKFFGIEDKDFREKIKEELEEVKAIPIRYANEVMLAVKEENKYLVKKLIAIHNNSNGKPIKFDLTEESDGTQRLIDFIPIFHQITQSDSPTFIIDEIDQSIHPNLLYSLVKKLMDTPDTKGQLIFTTHEANLLDLNIFRQDEIWFTEKKDGATHLYSLSEFKPRNDLDIRKGYLKGRFGAIPFTADLKNLNWPTNDA